MTAARAKPARTAAPSGAPALLDRAIFYALLALFCVRPLLSETFERIELSFIDTSATAGPTPATTAWLDAALLALAVVALARSWRAGGRLAAAAIGLLLAAVVVSTLAAGDRRSALLAGGSLWIGVVGAAALFVALRARWMTQLLLVAVLATGFAFTAKCLSQRAYEFRDLLRYWEEEKPRRIAAGADPTDPTFVNFERRMRAGDVFGFVAHPNVAGSCLLMWLALGAGLFAAHVDRRSAAAAVESATRTARARTAALLVSAALLYATAAALWFTGSRGAVVGTLFALPALFVLGAWPAWCERRAAWLVAAFGMGCLSLIIAGAAYGAVRGTLPHDSLAFRWHYWTAASRAWLDDPLTGIGRGNFADAFLRYKPIQSPEEVKDLHSVWLALLVELGPLGLLAALLLLFEVLTGVLRRLVPDSELDARGGGAASSAAALSIRGGVAAWRPVILTSVAVLFVHMVAWNLSALITGGPGPFVQQVFDVWLWTCLQQVVVMWAAGLVLALWLFDGVGGDPRAGVWFTAGCAAGLLGVLVHNLIDFALFTPAGLALFGALAVLGLRLNDQPATFRALPDDRPRAPRWRAMLVGAGGAGVLVAFMALVVVPITRSERAVHDLAAALAAGDSGAAADRIAAAGEAVLAASPRDADAAAVTARALLGWTSRAALTDEQRIGLLDRAFEAARLGVARNRHDVHNRRLMASIQDYLWALYRQRQDAVRAEQALIAAVTLWEDAVRCYPTDPRLRISAGRASQRLWQATGRSDAARNATFQLEEALRLDDCRPPEEVVRLRPQERAEVAALLAELRAERVTTQPPAP